MSEDGIFQILERTRAEILADPVLSDPLNRRVLCFARDTKSILLLNEAGEWIEYYSGGPSAQIMDGGLTFATNYPPDVILGSAAVYPPGFWKTGRVVVASGIFQLDSNPGGANTQFHIQADTDRYIQAVNLSSVKPTASYEFKFTCVGVSNGDVHLRWAYVINTSDGTQSIGDADEITMPATNEFQFFVLASGPQGSVVRQSGSMAVFYN